jgi:tetrahydrodipicolinate N-succinyltransferase
MWNEQQQGMSIKLIVYFHDNEPVKVKTYYAFLNEEKKGTAIQGLTKRILQKKVFGMYKTAIFYRDGAEVERWVEGLKQ